MSAFDNESRNADNGPPSPPLQAPTRTPQQTMDAFWKAFTHKYPGKIHQILPVNPYAASKSASEPKGNVSGHPARESYEEAKADCIAAVEKIAKECRRCNLRYRDPHFDIEWDLKTRGIPDCLVGLHLPQSALAASPPRAVKRVNQIFTKPEFYIDGPSAFDIRQGVGGDCWFLAALGALGNKEGLIERICVSRDEEVGVYGFVFYRDGQWIHTVVDDKLYLTHADWDESFREKVEWSRIANRDDPEGEYRKAFQTGSRALYFAQCTLENETWLPLLEKAFAKAHGDYTSIDGGFTGEAIEDLTGGVTTEMFTSDILDLDKFWKEELLQVNEEFLFGCATGRFDDWQGVGKKADRKGIEASHAYSIMEAREVYGFRLLKIRNPWGKAEWTGPWSDGSPQWTAELQEKLEHKFGDDGVFWISYEDWLRKYHFLDRTRLFDVDWKVAQQWTSVHVPWAADYNGTKFTITLTEPGPIVVVLSQLDDRYWKDFKGQYTFSLHFRINKSGEDDYIVRSHGNYCMRRSVSTEVDLEPGTYDVRMKITARRIQENDTIESVVKECVQNRPEKLLQVALSYDLAHAKGLVLDTEAEAQHQAIEKAKVEAEAKSQARKKAKELKYKEWEINKKDIERTRRRQERYKAHDARKTKQHDDEWQDEREEDEEARNGYQRRAPQHSRKKFKPKKRGNYQGEAFEQAYDPRVRDGYMEELFEQQSLQERVDTFNQDPALYGQSSDVRLGFFPGPQRAPSEAETIYTYTSSVDSDLDQDWFPPKQPDFEDGPDDSGENDVEPEPDLMEFASNPWNAVCVVGLRVFTKNGVAIVKVVRPGDEVPEEATSVDSKGVKHGGDPAPLDIDDQARGMSEDTVNPVARVVDPAKRTVIAPLRYNRAEEGRGQGFQGYDEYGGRGRRHRKRH